MLSHGTARRRSHRYCLSMVPTLMCLMGMVEVDGDTHLGRRIASSSLLPVVTRCLAMSHW